MGAITGAAEFSRRRRRPAKSRDIYRQLGRYSSAFALAVDIALLALGGGLKRDEMISARFGDLLSELYLLSAVLKRWKDEGEQEADLPLVAWCMDNGFATIEARIDEILAQFPESPGGVAAAFPRSAARTAPARTGRCPDAQPAPRSCSSPRPRATASPSTSSIPPTAKGLARLDRAFALVTAVQPLRERLHNARVYDVEEARQRGLIDADDAARLQAADQAVADVIAVDDFAADELFQRRQ